MPQQNYAVQTTAPKAVMSVSKMVSNEAIKARFNEVLGKSAPKFISSLISVSNLPSLRSADPQSVISAAMVAATLDLPINPNLGFAYILAYKDGKSGNMVAQFQMGYKGFIQLAMRSGQYKTINATDIRKGEIVSENILSGEIEFKKLPDDERAKAEIIGYAAYFRLTNGFEKTLYMSKKEVEAHALKYSSSYKNDKYKSSLWNTQFDLMAKKTVLKLLVSKYGPLSVDMQMATQFDQAEVKLDENYNIEEAEAVYVDNMPTEAEPQKQEDVHSAAERIKADNEAKAKAMAQAGDLFNQEGDGTAK